jgi:DNA-binding transcriptional ArsR family regulator
MKKDKVNKEFTFAAPSNAEIKKASEMYRAVKHPLRIQFLNYLNENKLKTVTELYVHFRLEQSIASQHLAILRRTGAVQTEREGKFIFYSVNYDFFKKLSSANEILNK